MTSSKIDAAKTFVALDLDRTLLHTDVFVELVFSIASDVLDTAKLQEIRRQEELHRGKTYDVIDALMNAGCTPQYLEKLAIERGGTRLLYDRVEDVLRWLDEHVGGWGIVTYGSHEGQRLKLRLVEAELGRTLPALITDSKHKPQLVATWREETTFVPPLELNPDQREYLSVVIVDDKLDNLPTDEAGQVGILIDNSPQSTTVIATMPDQLRHLLSVSG